MLYPLTFKPLFKERVWGGRKLETIYQKPLPPGTPIGESWEITDRPGEVSVITNGLLAGRDLHWLMQHHGAELLGAVKPAAGRFPLLVKILDAQDKLSLQVHPPAERAAALGGEPKTEMWYITEAAPGAELYVGLKRGATREEFERKLKAGTVAECFHHVPVKAGDAMFLPSGRVHAIGAGLLIFEIQQNSDTTYRVFDWNRVGLDGKPREVHVEQSLASIRFDDFEPALIQGEAAGQEARKARTIVRDPLFTVEAHHRGAGTGSLPAGRMQILGQLTGKAKVSDGQTTVTLAPGQFCLLPASLKQVTLQSDAPCSFLRVEAGEA